MEQYQDMMYYLLKKYGLLNKQDDFIDLCYIGYTKALNTFNNKKNVTFTTYVYKCMENELKQEIRKQNMKKRKRDEISLDYILQDGKNTYNFISDIDSTEEAYLKLESNKNIRKTIEKLEKEERIYLIEIYINNMTKFEITKKYKIGIHKLNEILQNAYLKLKEDGSFKNLL